MKRTAQRPVLITDAARSQDDELRMRERRYVLMMLIRAACVVAFAVLVATRPPMLWAWLGLVGASAVVIPWLAVILANDRPPKEQHRLGHHKRARMQARQRGLPSKPEAPEESHPTIDAEP